MSFKSAYDLELAVGNEVVFVREDDGHRKVRLFITELDSAGGSATFTGHSLGSSVRGIKAAKKDETPVLVKGSVKLERGNWVGDLTLA